MEQYITEYIKDIQCTFNEYSYEKINNPQDLTIIHDLFKNGTVNDNIDNPVLNLYYGIYYQINKNYDQMKQYFDKAIDGGNTDALKNMILHYNNTDKDYDSLKKYCHMFIKQNNNKTDTENANTNYEFFCDILLPHYATITPENVNDAMYYFNIAKKLDKKSEAVTVAYDKNYMVTHCHIMDYTQSIKISMLLLRYNNICVGEQPIFLFFKQIMLFLGLIKKSFVRMPMYLKLNIIALFMVKTESESK